ncbi:DUF3105 domain-containing protein [Catellatospora citrea]|uniref:DUF3105 domain-containing protein n=1 Tax=Catellatospora citrea TaxID=53366 RepID=A0A8J3KD47_9ACTN|nr:DUF3105 domain-containing protein [Catellatospora citrea]RKE09708.1 uncharacterized protein DUF3105 [Catellatospora citrea]GIG00743.1 hypothetical protein Cci01nite_58360 [Catellatospora citrea]
MSISTQGGEQHRPNVVKVGGKPAAGAKPGTKTTTGGGKTPPKGGKGGGPRKPITPIKVNQGRNWGPIAMFAAVGLIAVGIIGWGAWAAFKPGGAGYDWKTRAGAIDGITHVTTELKSNHTYNQETYEQNPPVGGTHSYVWQQCMGNVYDAPIPKEHAVHSLEHGAVWITYRKDLPADQVAALAAKVEGKEMMLLSPVADLDKPISLQAWSYQLKVDNASDPRIDDFIGALRVNATQEPGATCQGGNTATGDKPLTEEQATALQQQQQG